MNKSERIITIITVVVTLAISINIQARDITKVSAVNYLQPESKVAFASFMNSRAKFFISKNDQTWNTFNKVVNSYNNTPGSFIQLSNVEKHNFLKASNAIQLKLAKMMGTKALEWKRTVSRTTVIYKFAWEAVVQERDLLDVSGIKVPKLPTRAIMKRELKRKFDWGTNISEKDLLDVEKIQVPALPL